MRASARPLSPFTTIYRWQIQMLTSFMHRATGVALAFGTILLCAGLLALAAGPDSFHTLRGFCASWPGLILLFGWSWAFSFHLLNGIRHLLQDAGFGFEVAQFVRNGWIALIGSFVLTALLWGCVLMQGAGA